MQELSIDFIRDLAAASGLTIPEERLPLVLQQYRNYLETLRSLESVVLPMETPPAFPQGSGGGR